MVEKSGISVAHVTTVDMSLRYLLFNQLRSLRQYGYEVKGISSPGPAVATLEDAGIRHVPVHMTRSPLTPARDLLALVRLCRHFRRERYAIVHTHTPKPGLLGQLAARMAGVPIVVNTIHGFYFHEHMAPALRRFYVAIEKTAAHCSDLVLCQSDEDLQTALRERIGEPGKLRFLGNGIDLGRFDPRSVSASAPDRIRTELGIARDSAVVGFVGRLVEEKGLRELFAAARRIRGQVPNVHFLLVGPVDSEKPDAVNSATADEYGVGDCCTFTGMRHDLPELYSAMDAFVLPSHREGFPRTPMEASAMGVPCVVTDIRGCREAVEHGGNGLLVPLGDVEELALALIKVLSDSDLAGELGRGGRRIAKERFDERRVFETVRTEYERLLHEKGLRVPERPPVATGAVACAGGGASR
jgi:glycosyltransferase involved in cell wall biosynthesis